MNRIQMRRALAKAIRKGMAEHPDIKPGKGAYLIALDGDVIFRDQIKREPEHISDVGYACALGFAWLGGWDLDHPKRSQIRNDLEADVVIMNDAEYNTIEDVLRVLEA